MFGGSRKRMKASDVFRDTEFLFGKKGTFTEAFPEIEDLRVTVVESGDGVWGDNREAIYSKAHPPGEYVNCSNPLCYNGGVGLGQLIRNMTYSRTEKWEQEYMSCRGYEGSPKGRRKYGPCFNSFAVKIQITYCRD